MSWDPKTGSLDIATLMDAYADGLAPADLIEAVYERLTAREGDPAWIALKSREEALEEARALSSSERADKPLWGVPFGVKDNFDVAGFETTNGCRAAARMATTTAPIVERLQAAGAIAIGKNNMDQFGIGLNGTRTDYGIPRSIFDERYVSGGSTSGGGVAVGAGVVSFALGGDAAGSGRVPAAFNDIVGFKPTPGVVPNTGMPTPAGMVGSHSLLTLTVADAITATQVIIGHDPSDPVSKPQAASLSLSDGVATPRFRFAVPTSAARVFAGDKEAERLFDAAVARLEAAGGTAVPHDLTVYLEAAKELYEGPFIAQRTANLLDFVDTSAGALFPATREILSWGRKWSAMDLFRAQHRIAGVRQMARRLFDDVDLMVLPTTPTTVTVDDMLADNIALNAMLGTYTNFVNLLDLPAVSLPAGRRSDGLPLGVMLIAPPLADPNLAAFASRYEACSGLALFSRAMGQVDPPLNA